MNGSYSQVQNQRKDHRINVLVVRSVLMYRTQLGFHFLLFILEPMKNEQTEQDQELCLRSINIIETKAQKVSRIRHCPLRRDLLIELSLPQKPQQIHFDGHDASRKEMNTLAFPALGQPWDAMLSTIVFSRM